MIVTSITQISKTRAGVGIDYDDLTLVLSLRDIDLYGLKEGEEIPQMTWEMLLAQQKKDAVRKCGSLLQGMDYSEKGLRDKLIGAGFLREAADYAVEQMAAAHYIDDDRFARNYLAYHMSGRSRLRIRMDLQAKGVPEEIIRRAMADYEEENAQSLEEAELMQIRDLLRKRRYDPDSADYNETMKTRAFLQRKGYSAEVIRRAMERA